MSPLTNESLINHGSFVVGQVTSYEDAGDEDEENGDEADCDERDQFEYSAPVLAS